MAKPLYQQIKEKFQLGPASHMTHISNLAEIIKSGLLSHNQMKGKGYVDLSEASVQLGREKKVVPHTGQYLHDFVPIYFGLKTPMVMQHQDKNEEIIYLRFSLEILQTPGTIFSDGNARSNATKFFSFTNIEDLSALNPKAINAVKWAGDDEKKRQKQAEILIPNAVPFSQVFDIACYSKSAENRVLAELKKSGITKRVLINPGWYYVP